MCGTPEFVAPEVVNFEPIGECTGPMDPDPEINVPFRAIGSGLNQFSSSTFR